MPRLLWLKYGELLPADTGGKLRSYNLLRHLGRESDLTFVSYADRAHDPEYPSRISAALPGSRFIMADDLPGWRQVSAAPVLESLRTGAPLNVTRFTSRMVRRQLSRWLSEGKFDILLCDFLTPTLCLPRAVEIPTVLFEHNVESAVWARRTATISMGPKRALYEAESRATLRWERRMLERFDMTLAVSEADRVALKELVPQADVRVVETGVDVRAFTPDGSVRRRDDLVVFLGSMDWQPNEDGVLWFMREVWPRIVAQRPGVVFRIVGRRPPPRIEALRGPNVEVTGSVDSVLPHLAEAALTVVPLRAGGGTRIKIFEAMAAGAAVVSTTLGAEGLPVSPGKDIVIADQPQEMAGHVLALLAEPDRRTALAQAGRETAEARDWSRIAADLARTLTEMVASGVVGTGSPFRNRP